MSNDERIIGELKEFKRSADKRFDKIDDRLWALNWKIAGVSSVIAIMVTLIIKKLGG